MKKFAGTFHQNKQGDWVKCITEGGKPCSRHASGEHIKGTNLEEALETLHEDDDFGLGDSLPTVSSIPVHIPAMASTDDEPAVEKHHEPTETQVPKKDDKPVEEAVKPAKKPQKKTLHKKSPKKPAISKNKAQSIDYNPSSVKVDPKKHQEMLDAMIEEEKKHYHPYGEVPHKAKKGMLEYKTGAVREKHYQQFVHEIDKNKPIDITSSPVYHLNSKATIDSVSREMFPGVRPSSDMSFYLENKCEEAWKKMNGDQMTALSDYTSSSYQKINEHLMGKLKHYDDMKSLEQSISNMHEGLEKSVTDEDMLVYRRRFMGSSSYRSSEELTFYEAVAHGDGTLTRANFCSTTIAPVGMGVGTSSGNDTAYIIKVPKGTHGIYIKNHSYHNNEKEFILDKGLKYKVVGIYERGTLKTYGDNKSWTEPPIIALEIIPPDKTEE